jgi:hypothetical protein
MLAFFWAGTGAVCPTNGDASPSYNIFVAPSIVLYYGAVVACAMAVIGGGLSLWRARREQLSQAHRDAATLAVMLGLLVGGLLVFCSPLFNYAYDGGLYGFCPEI